MNQKSLKIRVIPKIKFFLTVLQKGDVNELKYRRVLINVFVSKIYLYDDKITLIFNSGDMPVTINDLLLSDIEKGNKQEFCLLPGLATHVTFDRMRAIVKSCEDKQIGATLHDSITSGDESLFFCCHGKYREELQMQITGRITDKDLDAYAIQNPCGDSLFSTFRKSRLTPKQSN